MNQTQSSVIFESNQLVFSLSIFKSIHIQICKLKALFYQQAILPTHHFRKIDVKNQLLAGLIIETS